MTVINYEQLRAAIDTKLSMDPEFRTIMKRINSGRATFIDTARYSQVLSHILGSEVSKMILNVDDREAVVSHLLHDSYEDINDVFGRVQSDIDKKKGLNIKPRQGEYPGERVEQFVHSLVDPTVEDSVIERRARAGTETITKSFHDDCIEENAKLHEEAGLKTYIIRMGTNCCPWCSEVAGKYEMKDQPQGIFRRHDNCDCTVIYDGQVLRGQAGNNGKRSKKWVEVPKEAGAAAAPRLSQEQAKVLEHEHIRISGFENEKSKLKSEMPQTIVNPTILNSPDYRKQYNQIDDSPQIIRHIYQNSKQALLHRSGTDYEDLIFIDSQNRNILKRTDFNEPGKVSPSRKMWKMIDNAEENTIIAIHNHPNSVMPSIDDINAARDRKYKYGVIACHNGNIYQYTIIDREYNENYVDMSLDNIQTLLYNKDEIGDKFDIKLKQCLENLRKFGLDLKVILWQ